MNPYEDCITYQEQLNKLNEEMERAYSEMKAAMDEGVRLSESPSDFPDAIELNKLRQRATDSWQEYLALGKKRLLAFNSWVDCLLANIQT